MTRIEVELIIAAIAFIGFIVTILADWPVIFRSSAVADVNTDTEAPSEEPISDDAHVAAYDSPTSRSEVLLAGASPEEVGIATFVDLMSWLRDRAAQDQSLRGRYTFGEFQMCSKSA